MKERRAFQIREILATHSVQNLFSLMEKRKIEIYKTVIIAVILYGCELCFKVPSDEGEFHRCMLQHA